MVQVVIDDITPREQIIASAGQTVFNTLYTADAASDIDVYRRADGVEADDVTQLVSPSLYNVTFVGGSHTVRVTFLSGVDADDVITIVRNTPPTRMNLYQNVNFTPSMLNQDFGILTLVDQQAQMYDTIVNPGYNVSATIDTKDEVLPILTANQVWAMNNANDEIIAYNVPAGGGLAPDDATYILQVANSELPNAQAMGALATGFVYNTTTTGIQAVRTITGTSDEIDIANGTGAGGNPTIGIADNPVLPGTESMIPPKGTTAERPGSPIDGMVRYNTTIQALEVYEATEWDQLSGGVVDTVVGTANQIDVDSSDASNPVVSLSSTLDFPGTMTIQSSTVIDSIIDDDTMATATDSNIPTSESVVAYIAATAGGAGGSDTEIQYNNSGSLDGDPGFTTDGAGTLTLVGQFNVDNLRLDGNSITSTDTAGDINLTPDTTGDLILDGLKWPQADGTTNQHLKTDGAAQIGFTTATYADTYDASELLYSNGANTVEGLTTANSALLVTNASGVPAMTASMTDGQIIIGVTGGTPVAATLTAGAGISIAESAGGITIAGTGSGIGWTEVTGTTQAMTADSGYVANNAGTVTFTLPTTAAFGTVINVVGKGVGGWQIDQNAGQNIQMGSDSSTVGVGGSVASTNAFDVLEMVCTTADTVFTVISSIGNITIV
jgi:hypothetical protein